ncbi:adenosylcobinamide-phosphate synthase [Shimia isoporae]|uniref:Cobalamin biosynthesis protein CobD n=1 Tax=Shimia isoporae TaxID=647720 RepID=A0A4V2Q221_9RHOB|nr:adenosylcobinamide-phosphate synthase CbiB [Shimia isoporae]TCL00514.1 adenosylcobinamide-phosphate synthase [Shimia isoporae]
MSHAAVLFLAMLLDALLGEPKALWDRTPHPAVLIGRLIGKAEQRLNAGDNRFAKGLLLTAALAVGSWALGAFISAFGWLPELLLAAILLAQRSLVDHVQAVGDALRVSLGDGKRAVAMIVSRDTAAMDESAVSRSAIESAAENLSDGVIAPAFWFLVAGLPGLLVYKAINTADSMIGYRNPRYEQFGKAAAKLDDLLNWIPARLTAALIGVTHRVMSDWPAIASDARLHRSPNAGWPESAMARALGIAIAGPRAYDGEMREFPFVNAHGRRSLSADDIDLACGALWRAWALALATVLAIALL